MVACAVVVRAIHFVLVFLILFTKMKELYNLCSCNLWSFDVVQRNVRTSSTSESQYSTRQNRRLLEISLCVYCGAGLSS